MAFATVFRDINGVYPSNLNVDIQTLLKLHNFDFNKITLKSTTGHGNYYERPLLHKLRYLAIIETHYLLELYDIYYDKLMERFNLACEMNLNLIRNCKNDEKLNKLYQVRVPLGFKS
jgi:hypothetical protein